ncbi:glycosyltransferase family 39 protein [Patescibacteria group bacterium]|nr:glycosyltransferase family 39 protein [Patescibacteria group bacterium]
MVKKFLVQNWLIIIFWLIGLFLRCYRQDQLLGFYYDQGRDALMSTDILSFRHFPAIGPTTGINGLYLGPFWYYLITPGYLLGRGSPAIASLFIAFIESLTIPLIYFLLKTFVSRRSALIAAFLWASSHYLIRSARWFSNPSPLPAFVVGIMILLSFIIFKKRSQLWPWLFLLLGLSFQLEAASAFFFIPIILTISILNFPAIKKTPLKTWILSLATFLFLLIPQFLFEFKNHFPLTKTFIGFLTGKVNSATGQTWAIPNLTFALNRLVSYYHIFFSKIDTNVTRASFFFLIFLAFGLILLLVKRPKNKVFVINFIWLFLPLFLLLFFVGNYGQLYDYYLTGYFPAFIILIGLVLDYYLSFTPLFYLLLIPYLSLNMVHLKNYLIANPDGPTHVSLGNELLAVKYICQKTLGKDYNTDIYVPPIIPYPYQYLFSWLSAKKSCTPAKSNLVPMLFTVYEVDQNNPQNLSSWLQRQQNIGTIVEEKRFGGIVVQQRQRIYEKK